MRGIIGLLVVVALLFSGFSSACDRIYLKVGTGYKFDEENTFIIDGQEYKRRHVDPISARIELGCRQGRLSYGISHHSQWGTGWPIDQKGEPYKTEFFIDYEFSWDI